MVALSGQRTQFTWALNEYNKSDDPTVRARFVRHMAASIRNAMAAGFTKDEIARGKSYPAEEVQAALSAPDLAPEVDVSEAQAKDHFRTQLIRQMRGERGREPAASTLTATDARQIE